MTELATNERTARADGSGASRRGRREVMQWVRERVQRLPFRLGGQEPEMPLGARVLVLKGEARNDIGQMAIISGISGSQVEISYRDPTGVIRTRRKQRSSLIRLDEGVELVVNASGWPVIRQIRDMETDEQGDQEIRAVSSEDES